MDKWPGRQHGENHCCKTIEKRMKRNEDSLRDLWDNIKWTNIHIIGVPEGKGREKGPEKIFEEIRAENFPNIGKETFNQVQEAQKVPGRINLRRNTPRHIVIKMTKIKDRDKILKATREKRQVTYKGTPIKVLADQWQPSPILLPGKSHGRRSLVGCSPWGHEGSDMTERLHFHFSLLCIGEGNGNPLQCSCLENPRDGGAWWAAIYGVAQSQTRLKPLSSSSSSRPVSWSRKWA